MVDEESQEPDARGFSRVLAVAALVGVLAGGGVVLFLAVEHQLQNLFWQTIPDQLGGTPGWWVFTVLVAGAVGVWAALKLPGHGGHRPLDGMGASTGPSAIGSVAVAALLSLSIGAVVGPEAPLMAVGSAIAGFVAMRSAPAIRQVLMLAGAAAAITMILGNPMVSAVLILEGAALKGSPGGKKVMLGILPVLVAMGFGYLIQVGVGDWNGVGQSQLAVPGLPEYTTVKGIDLLLSFAVGIVVAALAVFAVEAGTTYQNRVKHPLTGLLLAAVVVAGAAVATRAITGEGVDLILFSGQVAMPTVLGITSVGSLLVIALAKTLAYSVSLGAGFRGGMVFPAVYLGTVVGVGAPLLVSGATSSPLVAAGIAAAVAAVLRLPFTGVLLALLLCAGAGLSVTTPAIIGAVIGVLLRVVADTRLHRDEPQPA